MEQLELPLFKKKRKMMRIDCCATCRWVDRCNEDDHIKTANDCLERRYPDSQLQGAHNYYYNLWEPREE